MAEPWNVGNWFQWDGAMCHTARETMNLLHEKLEGCVVSRGGDINWPSRSRDLTPLDFFLRGYVKSRSMLTDTLCLEAQHHPGVF